MSKHFLPNNVAQLVPNCLKGLLLENDNLSLLEKEKVIFNNQYDPRKVSLISGGGSGHEPGWSGFVGAGMLTAAAQGDVFASPNDKNIVCAEKATHSEAGTIFIITNYTGDNLYFGMASQELISRYGEDKIKLLRVTDDVAVGRTKGALVGRRTLAGCALVTKIMGAASERGYNIDDVYEVGTNVNAQIASINAGLDHVHIPGHSSEEDYGKLDANQIEIGLGIHNEPGVRKVDQIPSNEELIPKLLSYIFDTEDPERGFFNYEQGDEVVLLFNNLGGISVIEEKSLLFTVADVLESKYGILPSRVYSGPFITSLNAPIFTITLFNVTKAATAKFDRDLLFKLLDDPTIANGWSHSHYSTPGRSTYKNRVVTSFEGYPESAETTTSKNDVKVEQSLLNQIVETAAKNVIEREPDITFWDTKMGDGDCGKTLETGANAVLDALKRGDFEGGSALNAFKVILKIIRDDMGGTLGAILFIFMKAFVNKFEQLVESGIVVDSSTYAEALNHGVSTLCQFTKARQGHRTVMDVLIPFVAAFYASKDISTAVQVAEESAENTRKLAPKLGRATYVGIDEQTVFPPDPGAFGVYEIIRALKLINF
ncbi:dihydroxyacetone kinase isoenzyme I [Scheffersomyces stipitis CBS 6054]|uniref:Dihydroxyacetone kinase n=1 Tax=Scheffersomyces stipitis (strain ATCC 58785 / CBS 6054 / NBRC 10063 / NRRL Y-11545) TaxID=322104 RepID=A3LSN7_PICST|nr:dihydroxyacetone kinase isoenzyme I [Scheffersomyces stipitis CBS 6054]ABN65931.2 dihydroxyacetone kinase isoenzyme I [Scheffersomyces stipitis CBS 6054]KAG2733898.1 hypothetical protein G9P44_003423 [Scheffersomyces stipitis]